MAIKVWPFRPDWSDGVLEKLEWLTDVMASTKGAEQRRPQRLTPRRTMEATFLPQGKERSLFDMYVMKSGNDDWYIPLWYDVDMLRANAAADDTHLAMDYDAREFTVGGFALIRTRTGPASDIDYNTLTFEVVKVLGTSGGKLVVERGQEGTTARAWLRGSEMYPLRKARFTDQPQARVVTAAVQSVNMSFTVTEPNEWHYEQTYSGYGRAYGTSYGRKTNVAPLTPAANLGRVAVPQNLPSFERFRVVNMEPDYNQDMTFTYERTINNLDNENSIPNNYDSLGFATPVQQHTWFLRGRQELAAFRSMLYWLRGKVRPVWVPTFHDDVQIIAQVPRDQFWVDITDIGYSDMTNTTNRQTLAIQKNDGTWLFRRVLSATRTSTGERLELSEAFADGLKPSDIYKISFMALCRLSQDGVEMNHETDSRGLTKVVLTWRATPDLRTGELWTPATPPRFRECKRECGQMPRVETLVGYGPPDFDWAVGDALVSATYATEIRNLAYSQLFWAEEPVDPSQAAGYFAWVLEASSGKGYIYTPGFGAVVATLKYQTYAAETDANINEFLYYAVAPEVRTNVMALSREARLDYYVHLRLLNDHNLQMEEVWKFQRNIHLRNWLPMRQLQDVKDVCSDGALGKFCVQNVYNRDYSTAYPTTSRGSSTLYTSGAMYHLRGLDEANWPTDQSMLGDNYTHGVMPWNGNGVHYSCGCVLIQFLESHNGLREQRADDEPWREPEWILWWHRAEITILTKEAWPEQLRLRLYDSITGFHLRDIDIDIINVPVSAYADEYQRIEFWKYPGSAVEDMPAPETYEANLVVFRQTYGRESAVGPFHQDPWVNEWNLVPASSNGFIVEVFAR